MLRFFCSRLCLRQAHASVRSVHKARATATSRDLPRLRICLRFRGHLASTGAAQARSTLQDGGVRLLDPGTGKDWTASARMPRAGMRRPPDDQSGFQVQLAAGPVLQTLRACRELLKDDDWFARKTAVDTLAKAATSCFALLLPPCTSGP